MTITKLLRPADRQPRFRFVAECLTGCSVIVLLALCGFELHFNSSTVGFLSLVSVVYVAIVCGFWQATVTSVMAVLCLDYLFQPPLFVLTVADPQDWIALSAFEVSALVVSRLSSREHRNAREATQQRVRMEQLYELSRSTLLIDLHQPPGPQLVHLIHRIFNVDAVSLYDANLGRLDRIGPWTQAEQDLAKDCYILDTNHEDTTTNTAQRVMRLVTRPIGALVIRGDVSPLMVNALASLAAIAFERFHSFEKESRAEAANQSEQLRTTVLDAMAHAFKTPLTAIQTASSGLVEVGGLSSSQLELASLIEEETVRLNELCTRLLQTARLETEQVSLVTNDLIISQLISQVVAEQFGNVDEHLVQISIPDPTLAVRGDRELLTMILIQYMDNAVKYSFPGSRIDISARESRSEVLISVHNEGSPIRIEDRERIFERFYRSAGSKYRAAGTGIGLSIVKKAAEAQRGHVWVISGDKEGTTFFLSLPRVPRRSR